MSKDRNNKLQKAQLNLNLVILVNNLRTHYAKNQQANILNQQIIMCNSNYMQQLKSIYVR